MNQRRLRELRQGETFIGFYLVKSKRVKTTKDGAFYIDLDLQDSSGVVNARIWDDAEKYKDEFSRGDIIKIEGVVGEWRDQLQIKIQRLRKAREDDPVNWEELMPKTSKNVDAMLAEIKEILDEISEPNLKNLINQYLQDEEFISRLKKSPAARNIHHSYLGGLLEHIWNMMRIAKFLVTNIYPQLNKDLLLAGVFLHDLGKILELEFTPTISYTKEGYLQGHIYLGLKMLNEKIQKLDSFPSELQLELEHIILSHHGEREWGSPVLPATAEAMLIHHIDNLDAKLAMVCEAIEADLNKDEEFTSWHPVLARHFYKRSFPSDKEPSQKVEEEDEL